jgi:thiamine biosynthesis lipoprotein
MKKILLLLSISLALSCTEKPSNQSLYFEGNALGTTYHIKAFSEASNKLISKKDVDSVITAVNSSLSTYQNNSIISRINKGEKIKIDKQFKEVFDAAKKIYQETDGIYDPTIGILVNAWGFGPKPKLDSIENKPTLVDSLKQYVGYNLIQIDEEGYLVKKYPQVYIDYNSIAKGYAIDRVGKMLSNKGVKNYLVEIGGEVLTKGINIEKNKKWLVAIDNPNRISSHKFISKIELSNQAMATSGNYRKFYIDKKTGKKYVHTLNPKTGYPTQSNLLSASIITNNCTLADGYATAFMAMGFEKSKIFLKNHTELQAFLVYSDAQGKINTFHSIEIREVE